MKQNNNSFRNRIFTPRLLKVYYMARTKKKKGFRTVSETDTRIKENKYTIVLYPDSTSYDYDSVLDYVRLHFPRYLIAKHWNDIDSTSGEYIKKPHTHVYFFLNNTRVIDSVALDLGLHTNDVEAIEDEIAYLKYLTHTDSKSRKAGKIEYDWRDFEANFDVTDIYTTKGVRQALRFADLLDYIDSYEGFISYKTFARWAVENDCISEYLRGYSSLKDIIKEHNDAYRNSIEDSSEWKAFKAWQGMRKEAFGGIPFGFYRADNVDF